MYHSPGIHYLKDPRTQHYNFSPFLEDITQPDDFDLEALQPYISPSNDPVSFISARLGRIELIDMGELEFGVYGEGTL